MQFSRLPKHVIQRLFLILLPYLLASAGHGQSIDIGSPSPVRTNEIVGRIAARDLGDSRLTDHFYALVGTPGDVLITVRGNNLNGDVDVFTTGSLRPLLKFTLYAESSSPVTKSIYLRKREDLIVRVEARSPNDDEGIYHIRLGGSFEPIPGEDLLAAAETPATESASTAVPSLTKGARRVSSVGARIAQPPPPPEEVAKATTPEPTPELTPEPTPAPTPVEASTPIATPERTTETEASAAPRRGRARAPARTRRPTPARPAEPPPEPEPQTGPRLIIEMQDGTRIERYMSTLRRVTVENNQIVVVTKLGRIERVRMAEVARMSIEP